MAADVWTHSGGNLEYAGDFNWWMSFTANASKIAGTSVLGFCFCANLLLLCGYLISRLSLSTIPAGVRSVSLRGSLAFQEALLPVALLSLLSVCGSIDFCTAARVSFDACVQLLSSRLVVTPSLSSVVVCFDGCLAARVAFDTCVQAVANFAASCWAGLLLCSEPLLDIGTLTFTWFLVISCGLCCVLLLITRVAGSLWYPKKIMQCNEMNSLGILSPYVLLVSASWASEFARAFSHACVNTVFWWPLHALCKNFCGFFMQLPAWLASGRACFPCTGSLLLWFCMLLAVVWTLRPVLVHRAAFHWAFAALCRRLRRPHRSPSCGRRLVLWTPVLQMSGLVVVAARTASRTRLPERRHLPRRSLARIICTCVVFMLWWCLVLRPLPCAKRHVRGSVDPLLGGGKSAQKQLQQLAATVNRLVNAVRDLQHQQSGSPNPRRPRKPKPKALSRPAPSSPSLGHQPPASCLWDRLQVLFTIADASGVVPSDEAIRTTMRQMLTATPAETVSTSRVTAPNPSPDKPPKGSAKAKACPKSAPKKPGSAPKPPKPDREKPSFAQLLKGSGPSKSERKPPKPQLVQQGWDAKCCFVSVKALHSLPDESAPLVVVVHALEELQELRDWAAASKPTRPVSCVDFASTDCSEGAEFHDVLVRQSNSPAIMSRRAVLHSITSQAPKPNSLKPKAEFQDKKGPEDAKLPETAVLRLTFAKEYADPTRYEDALKRPQALPSLLMPSIAVKILRTFAVATYEGEITCLVSIRASDMEIFFKQKLCPGGFVAPQRSSKSTVLWISRDPKQSPGQYLASARKAAEDTPSAYLAYRPGGRANLGIRAATPPKGVAGTIAPRWTLAGAPKTWIPEDVQTWLQAHGFKDAQQIQRATAESWFFRAWPDDGAGTAVYASGLVVAPAAVKPQSRPKANATAAPVWGARPLKGNAETASKAPPLSTAAKTQTQPDQAEVAATAMDTPDADVRDRSRSPAAGRNKPNHEPKPAATESVQQPGPRPALPHGRFYTPVECGGEGDCAYTSIARAMAMHSDSKPDEKDLKPQGKLQGYLRCEAAKYIRENPSVFENLDPTADGTPDELASKVAKSGTWADSIALFALAHKIGVQLRIWAFDVEQHAWVLYLVGPEPPEEPAPKSRKKKKDSLKVIWLKLEDQHYQWLKPVGQDWRMETALPQHVVKVDMTGRGLSSQLCGAGARSKASGRSCARLLGLAALSKSSGSGGSAACRRLLGLKAATTRDGASSAAQALGLPKPSKRGATSSCSEAPTLPEEASVFEKYRVGDLYICKCGWRPPVKGLTNAQIAFRARQHWRHCAGKLPPSAASQQVRQRVARAAWCNPALKRAEAENRYRAWYKKLKGKWLDAACTPCFEDPHAISLPKRGIISYQYRCTRCSNVKSLGDTQRWPCRCRDKAKGVTYKSWAVKIKGPEKALSLMSRINETARRFRAKVKQRQAES